MIIKVVYYGICFIINSWGVDLIVNDINKVRLRIINCGNNY